MKKQTNNKRQWSVFAAIALIIICGACASVSAQTSPGSYWSPAARALRQEIINRAILRQARHGGGARSRAHSRSARRSRSRRRH